MSFSIQTFANHEYPSKTALAIASALPVSGSVVVTGGTTAEKVYGAMPGAGASWAGVQVFFSDERCVPPDHAASNFMMARRLLFEPLEIESFHRMHGEDEPQRAAADYHDIISDIIDQGIDLVLLGVGADAHIGAMFPGSPVLKETSRLCRAVDRPDGMKGLTLTPPALLAARTVMLLVAGADKADAVQRVAGDHESPSSAPARLLANHPDARFILDEEAAALL